MKFGANSLQSMQSKDGYHCYYNVQTAVDDGSHLIAAYEVTNHCTDQGLLKEVADETRQNLAVETITVVADKGYDSRPDVEACVQNGIVPHVALKYDKEERCVLSRAFPGKNHQEFPSLITTYPGKNHDLALAVCRIRA